jgi:hypothetical protein
MNTGDEIEVLFKIKNTLVNQYFPGTVLRVTDSNFSIKYDNGFIETHPLNVVWRYITSSKVICEKQQ